jgi:hypothetical protein
MKMCPVYVGRMVGYLVTLDHCRGGGETMSGQIGVIKWNCEKLFVWNCGVHLQDYTESQPRRTQSYDYSCEIPETYNDSLFYSLTLKKTRMNQTQTVIIS